MSPQGEKGRLDEAPRCTESSKFPLYSSNLVVAIPVAAGLLVRWRIDLPMSVGAIAMSVSTIIVAINAQLLRHLKLRHEALVVAHR